MKSGRTWLDFASDTRVMVTLLAGGVIAFVVVFVILFSNASFTQTSKSAANSFTAGTTVLGLSQPGAIVDAAGLKPGQSRTGDIQVTNNGNAAANLSVTPTGAASAPTLAAALQLKVYPQGSPGNPVYNGTYAAAGRITLGSQGAGQTSSWTFQIDLPSNADAALGGTSLTGGFDWELRTP